ncbi:MAG: glycosyltransferase [Lachnospiraceae bacterium]|nr:glycosyltransferase [Lachnospiraceae bacterium]
MPKVSVIVPVYNVEKYVAQCLDSILAQTLQDMEIICVDDGSTDDSPAILDDYAKKDARIHVIHKENAGYGAAMNVGFDAAVGEYIGIVESDDRIFPEMYETLYQHATAHKLDMIKSDAFYWYSEWDYRSRIHRKNLDDYYDKVLTDKDRKVFFDFYMNTWTGIYLREFLEEFGIRHHETPGASYQDNGFWIQTVSFCRRAMWLNQAFYLYRQDNPMASIKSKDKIYVMSDEYDYAEKKLREKGASKESLDRCNYYRLIRHMGTFIRVGDEYKREFCDKADQDHKKYAKISMEQENYKKWYEEIAVDPDGFCHRFIAYKTKVYTKLKTADQILIYGCGNLGQLIFRHLLNMGMYHKISCFMISGEADVNEIAGIPVRVMEKGKTLSENLLVILAVSEKSTAYTEIADILMESGVKEWLKVSDITRYFYMV